LHTLERLVSYVRHSVVRVCFYNLKLFCPSLADEYDDHVRQQVVTNIDQLGAAQEELVRFFAQALPGGQIVASLFPDCQRRTQEQLDALRALARPARDCLDDEAVRSDFAKRAPGLIDGVMDALQDVQKELDSRKMAVSEILERAVSLAQPVAKEAGMTVSRRPGAGPKVFCDEGALLDCFVELITNAAKYAKGTELTVAVEVSNQDGQYVQVTFTDNGRGMAPDELARCLMRGASDGGTGEGLPMVVEIIEAEHLGQFTITAEPDEGCVAIVRLPVKWSANQ
jgi:signal transduction histidine kinase